MLSIANRPRICDNLRWRRDGEDEQIIILSKEEFPLPLILNPTASRIFLLCDGEHTVEDIAQALCDEFDMEDFSIVLEDVKKQAGYFSDKGILK